MPGDAPTSNLITLATLDVTNTDCDEHVFVPGHVEVGASVPCPGNDHEHVVLGALHTEVVDVVVIEGPVTDA